MYYNNNENHDQSGSSPSKPAGSSPMDEASKSIARNNRPKRTAKPPVKKKEKKPVACKKDNGPMIEYITVKNAKLSYSLSKAYLYDLINTGQIESISITRPGKKRGKRLIIVKSLEAYLQSFAA